MVGKKSDKSASKFSRRSFAKGAAGAAAVGLTGSATLKGNDQPVASEYDFVIVGSGAGGGPLAVNLAKAGFSVLVLEAGSRDNDNIVREVPLFHTVASEDEQLSWAFYTNHYQDPKRQASERKHYQPGEAKWSPSGGVYYPRGSTIGGSTAVNAMVTLLPHREDFDYIADITGDESWRSFDFDGTSPNAPGMIFKYMKRVETWLPVKLSDFSLLSQAPKLVQIILSAIRSQGLGSVIKNLGDITDSDKILDPNALFSILGKEEGIFQVPMAIGNPKDTQKGVKAPHGLRGGVRNHLLAAEETYANLTIQTDAFVSKLVFAGDEGDDARRVTGVEFMQGKKLYKAERRYATGVDSKRYPKQIVKARYEVILSSGAFNTPQLLKLSGIGPRKELETFSIPVRQDLPGVGTNLQDRYEVPVISQMKEPLSLADDCTFGQPGDPCLDDLFESGGKGSIYATNGSGIGIMKKTKEAKRKGGSPDLFVFGIPSRFDGYYEDYSKVSVSEADKYSWLVLKGHTNNTAGTVTLKSVDPLEMPEINFNYYDESNDTSGDDLKGMVEGVKLARETMVRAQDLVTSEFMPGDSVASDSEIETYIKTEYWGHHASCTCPIGADNDPMAVLDSKFRVRGIEGLRVVDASVFPKIPGLFIALPIYLVSEKASDDIIEQYR
ncbi:MAG: GMC family oxidoreductase [Pseudobacteriovorax sp.]|nr:GMC family oxidoreductase [Pseudobacteriovorax sp.]